MIFFVLFFIHLKILFVKAQEGIENVVRFGYKGVNVSFLWKDLIGFALWT